MFSVRRPDLPIQNVYIECAELAKIILIKLVQWLMIVCITLVVVAKLASLSCVALLQACTKASRVYPLKCCVLQSSEFRMSVASLLFLGVVCAASLVRVIHCQFRS